jgi:tetratricopeptide (TPR) repeat protein
MDEKLSHKLARLGGTVLAFTALCGPVAADDGSSMVFVAPSDADAVIIEDSSSGEPAEPSDLVIHTADDAAVTTSAEPSGQGDLAVVGGAVMQDDAVAPAGNFSDAVGNIMNTGPRRPVASAGIQGPTRTGQVGAPRQRSSAGMQRAGRGGDVPPAYGQPPTGIAGRRSRGHAAPLTTVPQTTAPQQEAKAPIDQAKEWLVSAYQLSLTASNQAEYSQIVQWCAGAIRVDELDEESRKFCAQLSSWALNRRGQERADEGQVDLALADFRAALEFAPNNWRALHNRGVTLAQGGQFAEAFDDLCRVVQLNPKFAKAYANRATLYVQAGDYDRALADYEAAVANDPQLLQAVVGRGRVCHLKGDLDTALACLDAAVRLEPTDAEIVCSRADLLTDLGRYEDALLDYAQAIDLNKKFEHAYRNGAWLLATCPDESIRDVEGALAGAKAALDCGYGERHAALDTMAAALANAGRYSEAVKLVNQAIEVAPEETRGAYEARRKLYQSNQPYRSQPVTVAMVEDQGAGEPAIDEQVIEEPAIEEPVGEAAAAVYVEE